MLCSLQIRLRLLTEARHELVGKLALLAESRQKQGVNRNAYVVVWPQHVHSFTHLDFRSRCLDYPDINDDSHSEKY